MNKSEIISICKKSDTLTKNQYLALYQIILHGDSFEKSEIADLLINHINKKSMYLLSVLWKDKDSLVRMCAYDTVSVYPAKFTYNYLISRISKENDELARSYIITSLTDISLREKVQGTIRIFKKLYIKEKSAYEYFSYLSDTLLIPQLRKSYSVIVNDKVVEINYKDCLSKPGIMDKLEGIFGAAA